MKKLTPLRRIRLKCLDCCCDSAHEVKLCTATDCSLYPVRFGKNPNRKGIGRDLKAHPLKVAVSSQNKP